MSAKKYVTVKCDGCGEEYQIQLNSLIRTRKRRGDNKCYCNKCYRNRMADMRKSYWKSLSEDEITKIKGSLSMKAKLQYQSMTENQKEIANKKRKDWYNALSDETKQEWSKRTVDQWSEMDPSEKKSIINRRIRTRKIKLDNMDKDEYDKYMKFISESHKKGWDSMPESKKKSILNKFIQSGANWRNSLTDEERLARLNALNRGHSIWRKNMSEKEKSDIISYRKTLWDNLPKQKKYEISKMLRNEYYIWWNSLSEKEKEDFTKNRLRILSDISNNSLHKRFERSFLESHLSNSFYFIPEYPTTNNGITHCWDYGIFDENGELSAVVDLDGSFFHADICDYNGIQCREEYDERRGLSLSTNTSIFIIHERSFATDFSSMLKNVMLSYEEYVDSILKEMRLQPFPEPRYSDIELIKSWNDICNMKLDDVYHKDLSLNTRIGDRLIQHFHPSIWRDKRKGELSPYEAWQDDALLRKCIENRVIYQTHLNPNKILQGFNVSKIAPKVSVFSAGRAKMIINRYLAEFDTIFDPFSGYSGRMLGALSLGKRYIGQDISLIHTNESNKLLDFLKEHCGVGNDGSVVQEDVLRSGGEYPCLFTCPPYADKEQWVEVPVYNYSCDDWIDLCMGKFKCKRYVFVVDSTTKYVESIVDIIENKSHFSNAKEFVIVINA